MTSRTHSTSARYAFTLNELLIVIAIIVLMLGLAVPAFNAMTGSKSIEGATNQISAFLGQARAEAIGIQETRGAMFFIDLATDRINIAMVRVDFTDETTGVSYIDLVPDRDFLSLPPGIGLQTINSPAVVGGDRYLGYNERVAGDHILYGGVILFDASGKLSSVPYGFECTNTLGAGTTMESLFVMGNVGTPATAGNFLPNARTTFGQFGVVIFNKEAFANAIALAGVSAPGTSEKEDYTANETDREAWVTNNASVVLINRYNGTLIKGD